VDFFETSLSSLIYYTFLWWFSASSCDHRFDTHYPVIMKHESNCGSCNGEVENINVDESEVILLCQK
jgi:hypothetical protein